jgi:anti-sigma factor RsiW
MSNIFRNRIKILSPATLSVGTIDATNIIEIISGVVLLDLPAIGTLGISAASAVVNGLTASHRVLVGFQASPVADAPLHVVASIGIAGGFQVTAYNSHTGSIDGSARSAQFFAWR